MFVSVDVIINHNHTLGVTAEVGNILHAGTIAELHTVREEVVADMVLIHLLDQFHTHVQIHVGNDVNLVHTAKIQQHLVNTGTLDMAGTIHGIPFFSNQGIF